MKQKLSKVIFLKILFIISPIVFLAGSAWIYSLTISTQEELVKIEAFYMKEKKREFKEHLDAVFSNIHTFKDIHYSKTRNSIKESVRLASNMMENIYNKLHDKLPEDELKKVLIDSLRGAKFLHGRGYFFVTDMQGYSMMHGNIKSIEKKNNVKIGTKGVREIHKAITDVLSKSSEGFVNYYWVRSKNINDKPSKKIAYVKYFAPYDWYIGAGDYIEDMEKTLKKNMLHLIDKVREKSGINMTVEDDKGIIISAKNRDCIGKNIYNLQSSDGRFYMQEIIDGAKKNTEGFFLRHKKLFKDLKHKDFLSFARYLKEWNWVIEAGGSIDVLEHEIANRQKKLKEDTKNVIIFLIVIMMFALVLVYFVANKFSQNIGKSFDKFELFFKKAANDNINLDIESMEYLEFEKLAVHTNELVNKIRDLNKKLEERVKIKTKELDTTSKKLKDTELMMIENEKMVALGELVAGVSHEVNTPVGLSLTGITHFSDISKNLKTLYENDNLSKDEFEEFIHVSNELADTITINLKRAVDIIKSFKIVAVDQTSKQMREFNLNDYIHEILLSLRNKTKKMDIDFTVDCDSSMVVNSNPGLISQVLTNLIINSMIHGFEDSKKGKISIIVKKDDKIVNIKYSDNGKGILKENLEKIFEPFYTTKKSKGGSGLGLHIIQKIIVSELNGSIECKSKEGNGVEFYIAFPV